MCVKNVTFGQAKIFVFFLIFSRKKPLHRWCVLFQEICLYILSLHKMMMGCVMDFFLPLLKKENFKVNEKDEKL